MAGFTSGANPDVVKTELDDVFYQEFNAETHPGRATAMTEMVFTQDSTEKSAEQEEVFKGSGKWGRRTEEESLQQSSPRVANKITHTVLNFNDSIDIPKHFFDRLLLGCI